MQTEQQGRAKIPRHGEVPKSYPQWLEDAQYLDLARTVAVSGIPLPAMRAAVHTAFCQEFGDDSVEECTASELFSKVVYVRFRHSFNQRKGQLEEHRTGYQCAYEAVDTLHQVRETVAFDARYTET